jgi:hypothetical protein
VCLDVICAEKVETGVVPKLMKMDDVECLEGEAAQFRAEIAQGTPAPTIQWFREDALIPENEDFSVSDIFY